MFDYEFLTLSITDPDIQAKLNALGQKRFELVNFHPINSPANLSHSMLAFTFIRDNRALIEAPIPDDWPSGVQYINKDTGASTFVPFEPAHAATDPAATHAIVSSTTAPADILPFPGIPAA